MREATIDKEGAGLGEKNILPYADDIVLFIKSKDKLKELANTHKGLEINIELLQTVQEKLYSIAEASQKL